MKRIHLIIGLLFLSTIGMTQEHSDFLDDFLLGEKLNAKNYISTYNDYDFSKIWTQTANYHIVGIIGSEHQRIWMKILSG